MGEQYVAGYLPVPSPQFLASSAATVAALRAELELQKRALDDEKAENDAQELSYFATLEELESAVIRDEGEETMHMSKREEFEALRMRRHAAAEQKKVTDALAAKEKAAVEEEERAIRDKAAEAKHKLLEEQRAAAGVSFKRYRHLERISSEVVNVLSVIKKSQLECARRVSQLQKRVPSALLQGSSAAAYRAQVIVIMVLCNFIQPVSLIAFYNTGVTRFRPWLAR